jgi:hypothetical protein
MKLSERLRAYSYPPHLIERANELENSAALWKAAAVCSLIIMAAVIIYRPDPAEPAPCPRPNVMQLDPTEIRSPRGSEVYEL